MSIGYIAMNFIVSKTCGRNKCIQMTLNLLKYFLPLIFFAYIVQLSSKIQEGGEIWVTQCEHEEFVKLFLGGQEIS